LTIESILLKDYPVGHKKEGNRAYSPLFLFKCLLLQKWFRIQSDPELESQINDRQSFQAFLDISAQEASPDHSTFLAMNNFKDGIMRKDTKTAKLTEYEIERNKKISKVRYIVEQYFGLSHLYDDGQKARFTTIDKNNIDIWFRQVAFNIKRGFNIFQRVSPA